MWTHIPTLGSIHQVTTCMHPPFPTNRVSEIKLYIWNNSHSHIHKISCVDLVVCRMYCHLYLECINGYQVGLGCNEPIFIFIVQLIWHHLSDLEIWSGRCVVRVQVRHTGHAAALRDTHLAAHTKTEHCPNPVWCYMQRCFYNHFIYLAPLIHYLSSILCTGHVDTETAIKHRLWTCKIIVEVLVLQHLRLSLTNCLQFSLCRYNLPQIAGRG